MCAQFHPKEDLVVSASLDQTVRVWDISGLRKKNIAAPGQPVQDEKPAHDLFGSSDAIVRHVLEGHDRGVNWASFHPSLPLVVSGADDRTVKLWRMNDSKAWEVDTCRGHFSNVSCVIFHPRQELIISNSEDKSIRVWDMSKKAGVQTFRREHDRFWVLAAHPDLNLFAAGHDNGLVVFKLERERPAFAVAGKRLFYVKDRYLRSYEFGSKSDSPMIPIRKHSNAGPQSSGPQSSIRAMEYNEKENCVILSSYLDGGTYDIYQVNKDGEANDGKRGQGKCATWVARSKFAVLDKYGSIVIKNLKGDEIKKLEPPGPQPEALFFAGTGRLLVASDDQIVLLDIGSKRSAGTLAVNKVKYVVWSDDYKHVALLSKHQITICDKNLNQLCTIHEIIRVKSGVWDPSGVFIYTTLNHIKYALPEGDSGIIRTLDMPIYVTKIQGNFVYCLDRQCKTRVLPIDNTEFQFKVALVRRNIDQVLHMVRNSKLVGQSIIAYLQKKGYPEVALHFVKDERTRFGLALECGNIEVGLESAKALDDKDCWNKLADAALKQGNHEVVEVCYQKTKSFEKLSFIYLITGNLEKLQKMMKIAALRQDLSSQYQNALYNGDVESRVKILRSVGQNPLAYVTAATFGMKEKADELATAIGDEHLPTVSDTACTLLPPEPVLLNQGSWPLLRKNDGPFGSMPEKAKDSGSKPSGLAAAGDVDDAGWGSDSDDDADNSNSDEDKESEDGSGWDNSEDEEIELDEDEDEDEAADASDYYVAPKAGTSKFQDWVQNSSLAADHAAAGDFASAQKLLQSQIGLVDLAPLKGAFMAAYTQSRTAITGLGSSPSVVFAVNRNWRNCSDSKKNAWRGALPQSGICLATLGGAMLQGAYKDFAKGKFENCVTKMREVLYYLPMLVCSNSEEVEEATALLDICREYILGCNIEKSRKENKGDANRNCELASYFTHCELQPAHLMLTLKSAMTASYKLKNLKDAGHHARRVINTGLAKPELVAKAKKIMKACDKSPTNEVELDYDSLNPFTISGDSFKPIYKGKPTVRSLALFVF